jgi:hypothetical protein
MLKYARNVIAYFYILEGLAQYDVKTYFYVRLPSNAFFDYHSTTNIAFGIG